MQNYAQGQTVAMYHGQCADMRQQLEAVNAPEGVYYIVSIENKWKQSVGGRVCTATLRNAARCIVEGTHALASGQDIERYHAECEASERASNLIEAKRNKQTVIVMQGNDPTIINAQQAVAATMARKGKE